MIFFWVHTATHAAFKGKKDNKIAHISEINPISMTNDIITTSNHGIMISIPTTVGATIIRTPRVFPCKHMKQN